jgi:hypothetical protein
VLRLRSGGRTPRGLLRGAEDLLLTRELGDDGDLHPEVHAGQGEEPLDGVSRGQEEERGSVGIGLPDGARRGKDQDL